MSKYTTKIKLTSSTHHRSHVTKTAVSFHGRTAPRVIIVTINNVYMVAGTIEQNISQYSEMLLEVEGIQNKQVVIFSVSR